jgi:uncharacterized protein (UPF0548 family)
VPAATKMELPMYSIFEPTDETIEAILSRERHEDFSYDFVGATRKMTVTPRGYDCDHNRICLGSGESVFTRACAALRHWEMFNLGWVKMTNPTASIEYGTTVLMMAHCYGLWWLNICRIVYLIDETGPLHRFGFAYGTLPHHVERGEERFSIEWNRADDSVWYDIYAFSKPAYWMVKLGYPLARRLQRRFARDSKHAMLYAASAAKSEVKTIAV